MKLFTRLLFLTIALLFVAILSNTPLRAQTISQEGQYTGYQKVLGSMWVDSLFKIPLRPLIKWKYTNSSIGNIGLLQVNPQDSLPYYGRNETTWWRFLTINDTDLIKHLVDTGSIQTLSLSAQDSLHITDGNTIWLPYLRKSDSTTSWVTITQLADSTSVLRIFITGSINDTAIAIRNYLLTALADSASAIRLWANGKFLTSVSITQGTGIIVSGGSPTYTISATGSLTAGSGISVGGSFPTYTITNTSPSSGGTVTSVGIVSGNGITISGTSPITSSGTFTISGTGSLTAGTGISISGSFPTYTVTNSSPSSGGTVTSVGIAAGTGINVIGSPITGSGTMTVSATGSITAGANVTVNGSFPTVTVNATTSAGGANTSVQYNNSGSFGGITNFTSASGEVLMTEHSYSATPAAPSSGSGLPWVSNANGRDELHIIPPSGFNDYPVQAAIKQERIAHLIPTPSTVLFDDFYTSQIGITGTQAINTITYDANNLAPNRLYYKLTGTASTNVSCEFRYQTAGGDALIGNNSYGAGSQLTIICYLPAYVSTQRFFVGFTSTTAALNASSDPSAILNIVGVGKDAGDATLQIMFNNGSGTATKVNTGITPTVNDEYMVVVTIPPNGANETVYIERRTKAAVTFFSATNSAKVPSASTLMYMHAYSNSAAASTGAVIGIGRITDEEFY